MEAQPELVSGEVKHLQRCINDLVSLLALPAIWSGGDPSQLLHTLLDALIRMLSLDLVSVRLTDPVGGATVEVVRLAELQRQRQRPMPSAHEICEALSQSFKNDSQKWPPPLRNLMGEGDVSIVSLPLGLQGELGVIVAAAERTDFPRQTETLLLSVGGNQASIGIQEAWFRSQQKRIADELDQRVAQRTAELAAANSELQLQVGLLQHLPVSAWTLKPDGTPDFVNQVWLEYSGQTLDFVRSHPEAWMTAVHPEDREAALTAFWDGVRTGRGFAVETRSLRAQDGTYRWHLNQAVVLRDAEGKVLKFVGTTTDIDDQKHIEDALRQAQGDLARINRVTPMGELTASLAHELSQPISGAVTNANTCLRKLGHDKPDLDGLRTAVIRIARDTQRATEIISRIRSQFKKGAMRREVMDVNEINRETIALLRDEATRYNISVRTELAADLPRIVGDRVPLQQVAMNLIVKSHEAMKESH